MYNYTQRKELSFAQHNKIEKPMGKEKYTIENKDL